MARACFPWQPRVLMAAAQSEIPILTHVAPVAEHCRAWFVDIWGVLHNGVEPFVDAVIACQTFKRLGGAIVLVSNSPRPCSGVADQLRQIGVPDNAYDAIISSGDASQRLLQDLGPVPVFHLGPERDQRIYDGFNGTRSKDSSQVAAIVCTGLFDDETDTPDDYRSLLKDFAARKLDMICANPDLRVERGGKLIYCAGALAKLYEELGGTVHYAGKPYPPIYKMAEAKVANLLETAVSKTEILAIGDGVHTDIEGAARAGIDAVYITSRVHMATGGLDSTSLAALFSGQSFPPPIAAMSKLVW